MAQIIDLSNCQFGFLTVIERADPPEGIEHRLSFFKCSCRCGAEVVVRSDALRGGSKRKCSTECPYRPENFSIHRMEYSSRHPDGSQQIFEVKSEEKI